MKKIAIIPARLGSKGLKNKNIKKICGKPLLVYTIEAALKSKQFSEIIVSSDSDIYGKIVEDYDVKFIKRSKALSKDNIPTFYVIKNILRNYYDIDYFVLLQPTSPLRRAKHIFNACQQFEKKFKKFDFLVSVKEAEHDESLVKKINKDNSMKYFSEDYSKYNRQKYKFYEPNGAIFIGKPKEYLKQKHFFGSRSLAFIMNKVDSIDIDDKIDFEIANYFITKEKK